MKQSTRSTSKRVGSVPDELCTIFTKYAKPLIILGNLERIAYRNHVRIDLDNSELGVRMMEVAPFGDRTTAKANQRGLARHWHEHLECHHGSRVGQR